MASDFLKRFINQSTYQTITISIMLCLLTFASCHFNLLVKDCQHDCQIKLPVGRKENLSQIGTQPAA